jgi:hypothetical protein
LKCFKVIVYGRNFKLAWRERRKRVVRLTGFYTTRFVSASNPREAEYEAMAVIRADDALRTNIRNSRTNLPIMVAVEIEEVSAFPVAPPGGGYTFFTGRGAGRPRQMDLAPFPKDAPKDATDAATRRYGAPSGRAPTTARSIAPKRARRGA